MPKRIIWWIKRDFRLADNAALTQAIADGHEVLPVFAFEPALVNAPDTSEMHVRAWCQALTHLRGQLRDLNADLFVTHRDAVETFAALRANVPFDAIYSHEEVGIGLTFNRDKAVAAWCASQGVAYREFPQSSVKRGGVNRDRLQELWADRIAGTVPLPAVTRVPMSAEMRAMCAKTLVPTVGPARDRQVVTEAAGRATLADFLRDRGLHYSGGISSPNTAFHHGSRLSVHLAWGTVSTRQAYHATATRLQELDAPDAPSRTLWRRSLNNFLARLHWRDHFIQRLETEPAMESRALHPAYRAIPYEDDPKLLEAWAEGRTGFPMIDAVMRCLGATGFANFRMRAMAVSFACAGLHLDWRTIHNPLAKVFLDFEPGIHFSQLQMQAGVVGLNTIRVYSPAKQFLDQDPAGAFVKRWVTELRRFTPEQIADHDADPLPGYVAPVVDFRLRSATMKALLFGIRKIQSAADTAEVYRKHGSRRQPSERRTPGVRRVGKPVRSDQPSLF